MNRWEFDKAVRFSGLPSPSRTVLWALASWATWPGGVIPAEYTPSLGTLVEATGLSRSAVTDHLNKVETGGWVSRQRPDVVAARAQKERTQYALAIPPGASPGGGLVRETDQPTSPGGGLASPGDGLELVREADGASPGGGPKTRLSHTSPHTRTRTSDARDARTAKTTAKKKTRTDDTERLDVERVCRHLADRIEANGSNRPEIGKKWRTAARLLIDKDGRTVDQILTAIDWCQDSTFWRANVLSMPTLREKYDQLRLQAQREREDAKREGASGQTRRGGPFTGANRFRNDHTAEQRTARNPFAGNANAIIASQHTGEPA